MEEILLAFAIIVSIILVIAINIKLKINKLAKVMSTLFLFLIIWCLGLFLQKIILHT